VNTTATQPTRRDSIKNGLPIAIANQVEARHIHAAKCKKPLDECFTCRANIAYFETLPSNHLTVALENRTARPQKIKFGEVIVQTGSHRATDNTTRGTADYKAAEHFFQLHKNFRTRRNN
jgi:hypothetical protein